MGRYTVTVARSSGQPILGHIATSIAGARGTSICPASGCTRPAFFGLLRLPRTLTRERTLLEQASKHPEQGSRGVAVVLHGHERTPERNAGNSSSLHTVNGPSTS